MSSKKVILLQNSVESLSNLKKGFNEAGDYSVIGEFTDGEKGIDCILDKEPDLVVIDIIMTGMDGVCVMERMRQACSKSKVVVLSNLSDEN